jgi:hypothetical protein
MSGLFPFEVRSNQALLWELEFALLLLVTLFIPLMITKTSKYHHAEPSTPKTITGRILSGRLKKKEGEWEIDNKGRKPLPTAF